MEIRDNVEISNCEMLYFFWDLRDYRKRLYFMQRGLIKFIKN